MASEPVEFVNPLLRPTAGLASESEPADGQLLERFVTGRDEAAFGTLVQRHGRMVLGVCRRREQSRERDCQSRNLPL